jgi:DNA replication protein DnaC
LGKTHLAIALGYQACLMGCHTLFASAADIINTLSAAQAAHRLKAELKRYLRPALLVIDELGFLPIDKHGADRLLHHSEPIAIQRRSYRMKDRIEPT